MKRKPLRKFFMFVGTRPNFMKIAPLCKQMRKEEIEYEVYHSGQHYDTKLSSVFLKQLSIDHINHMNCDHRDNAIKHIQSIIKRTKEILTKNIREVRAVIVVGDVSTTYAVTLAARELGLKIAHVESGLRSFDISMPEELNRITVDHLSDYLFAPSIDAIENLAAEGIQDHVYIVGNVMIDCLINIEEHLTKDNTVEDYIVSTFHRPSNVDKEETLKEITHQLIALSKRKKVYFFVHPRTKKNLEQFGLMELFQSCNSVKLFEPIGYLDFMQYLYNAKVVVTDSGGIQEETTYLDIPCFTARENTERPVTIREGTNKLISIDGISKISFEKKTGKRIPYLWDGDTSLRIVNILSNVT